MAKPENRRQLMESFGAVQRNTVWSWCAVNGLTRGKHYRVKIGHAMCSRNRIGVSIEMVPSLQQETITMKSYLWFSTMATNHLATSSNLKTKTVFHGK